MTSGLVDAVERLKNVEGIGICELAPGGSLHAHLHSFEESFYVVGGTGVLDTAEGALLVGAGDYGMLPVGAPAVDGDHVMAALLQQAGLTPDKVLAVLKDIRGNQRVTTQNLVIAGHDAERGLLLVKGAIPGSKGGYVLVRDAVKRARHADAQRAPAFGGDGVCVGGRRCRCNGRLFRWCFHGRLVGVTAGEGNGEGEGREGRHDRGRERHRDRPARAVEIGHVIDAGAGPQTVWYIDSGHGRST